MRDVRLGARLIRRQMQIASPENKTLTILLRLERGGPLLCNYIAVKITITSSVSSSILLARTGIKLAHYSYMIAVSAGLPASLLALSFHKKDFNIKEVFEVFVLLATAWSCQLPSNPPRPQSPFRRWGSIPDLSSPSFQQAQTPAACNC